MPWAGPQSVDLSFRLRLALWYGGLTAAVLVLCSVYAYAVHSRTHYDELDAMLHRAAEYVAGEMAGAATPGERSRVLTAARRLGTEVRAYGSQGEPWRLTRAPVRAPVVDPRSVLRGPPQWPYGVITAFAPALHPVIPARGAFDLATDGGGMRWRVFALPLNATTPYLVTAVPLARLDDAVRQFGWLMLGMTVVGCALVCVGGWLIAGRALRPLAVLTDTARAIAASRRFDRRVPVAPPRRRPGRGVRDELARLAETFNGMLASLEAAYAAQQRFVADASHELRAPLTVVQANLQLLRRVSPMPAADQAAALADATAEADRLGRLVHDLLALARADAGIALRRAPVALDRIVMVVLGEARALARGQRLEVGPLEPTTVLGDVDQLQQLLLILVDNALKYTPAGGTVRLSLVRRASPASPASHRADRQHAHAQTPGSTRAAGPAPLRGAVAELRVEDTGIGIAPAELSQVFDRFYRADAARSRDPGGTGLGLSIAQWIATQHRGTLRLASVPGGGTTAVIELPAGVEDHTP